MSMPRIFHFPEGESKKSSASASSLKPHVPEQPKKKKPKKQKTTSKPSSIGRFAHPAAQDPNRQRLENPKTYRYGEYGITVGIVPNKGNYVKKRLFEGEDKRYSFFITATASGPAPAKYFIFTIALKNGQTWEKKVSCAAASNLRVPVDLSRSLLTNNQIKVRAECRFKLRRGESVPLVTSVFKNI